MIVDNKLFDVSGPDTWKQVGEFVVTTLENVLVALATNQSQL